MFLPTFGRNSVRSVRNVFCVLIVLAGLFVLGSSASGAVKTAIWTGGGGDSSYNNPANWTIDGVAGTGVVPINDLTDTYAVEIDGGATVNFDVPTTGNQVFQFDLSVDSTFNVNSGRELEVTDSAAISGIVTTTNGTLLAGHASSSFGGNQSRTTVAGGGDITLGAASYSCKDLNGVFTIFSADSTDSTLNLPQLASIDASRHSGTVLVYTVKASAGGAINLSALTSISGPTYDGAKDRIDFIMESGGVINLDSLSTTTSGAGKVRFDIRSAPGGVFSLPALDQSDDAEFIVPTGLTMNLGTAGTPATQVGGGFTLADGAVVNYTPLTKLQWASIDLTGSSELHAPSVVDIDGTAMTLAPGPTLDMGVITSMDDARLAVTGGAKWGVAQGDLAATSYTTNLNGQYTIFSASGSDAALGSSTLDLSTLTSIDASRYSGTVLVYTVRASAGGTIDLSGVTSISGPTYDGAKDRIDFIMESGGVINLDNLSTTTSGNGKVRFDIRSAPGGVFSLPAIEQSDDAEFIVPTGLTMNLGTAGTPATQVGGGFTLADGAVVNYTPLTKLQWASIDLTGSSELHAPSVVDIDGTAMTLAPGPTLDMGVITSMDDARLAVTGGAKWGVAQGDLAATSYSCANLNGQYTIFSASGSDAALGSSTLDLSTLTSIDASRYSGTVLVYTVRASAGGTIDLSGVTSVSGPTYDGAKDRIDFIMESGGVINLDNLSTTTSGNGKVRFDIRIAPGGVFSLPALEQSDDAEFIVPTGLTMNLGTAGTPATQVGGGFTLADGAVVNYTPLTKLQWASIDLTGSSELHVPSVVDIDGTEMTLAPGPTVDMGQITSMDDARLAVTGGAKWGVAQGDLAATSYSCANLNGQYTIFSASGSDAALGSSTLDLSTLTSIDASRYSGTHLVYTVKASDNGLIDLSSVMSVSAPTYATNDSIDFIAETGGTIDLSSLQTVTVAGNGEARFFVSAGGTMFFGEPLQTDALNLSVAGGASKVIVGGGFHLDPTSDLSITGGATLQIAGDFSHKYASEANLNADDGILHFHTAGDHRLEVAGLDLGAGGSTSGNLGLGRLLVGDVGAEARVTLANLYDNLNPTPGGIEALYLYGSGGLDGLEILGGSMLIIGNVPVYAWIDGEMKDLHTLFGPGEVIIPFQDAGGFNDGWLVIPEPATFTLLTLSGLAILRRKRRV